MNTKTSMVSESPVQNGQPATQDDRSASVVKAERTRTRNRYIKQWSRMKAPELAAELLRYHDEIDRLNIMERRTWSDRCVAVGETRRVEAERDALKRQLGGAQHDVTMRNNRIEELERELARAHRALVASLIGR